LLLLALCCCLGVTARKANRASRSVQAKRRDCERGSCQTGPEDDRGNCVLRCQSALCFQKIYGEEELEPGEIDPRRSRTFTACLNAEERETRRQKLRERRYGGSAPSPADAAAAEAAVEAEEAAEEAAEEEAAQVAGEEAADLQDGDVVEGGAGDEEAEADKAEGTPFARAADVAAEEQETHQAVEL